MRKYLLLGVVCGVIFGAIYGIMRFSMQLVYLQDSVSFDEVLLMYKTGFILDMRAICVLCAVIVGCGYINGLYHFMGGVYQISLQR